MKKFLKNTEIKILFFKANNCAPCSSVEVALKFLKTDIKVEKIILNEFNHSSLKYDIKTSPTLILVSNFEEISRLEGFKSKVEIEAWVDKYLKRAS